MNTRTHALCDVIQEAAARQHEAKQAVRLLEASVGKAQAAPEDAAVTCADGDSLGCETIQVGHGWECKIGGVNGWSQANQ